MEQSAANHNENAFTCIVIDDSDFARMNLKKVIVRAGGEVIGEAKNGKDAADLYEKNNPDLVLLDITMPVVDGLEALSNIMEKDNEARVIIVSSLGNKDMIKEAITRGAKQFVTKPFNADHVSMIIKSVVGIDEEE
jgi:two-component system chemotaxis response regulator CheY